MKQSLNILSLVLCATLVACNNSKKESTSAAPQFIGTWHYERMTRTVQGEASDTLVFDYVANPYENQFYEVYTADSVMTFYIIQKDTLLDKREYHFAFRNDTLYVTHPEKPIQSVHVVEATENTITIDYTREHNDSTYYFTATTRRCELPTWNVEK